MIICIVHLQFYYRISNKALTWLKHSLNRTMNFRGKENQVDNL